MPLIHRGSQESYGPPNQSNTPVILAPNGTPYTETLQLVQLTQQLPEDLNRAKQFYLQLAQHESITPCTLYDALDYLGQRNGALSRYTLVVALLNNELLQTTFQRRLLGLISTCSGAVFDAAWTLIGIVTEESQDMLSMEQTQMLISSALMRGKFEEAIVRGYVSHYLRLATKIVTDESSESGEVEKIVCFIVENNLATLPSARPLVNLLLDRCLVKAAILSDPAFLKLRNMAHIVVKDKDSGINTSLPSSLTFGVELELTVGVGGRKIDSSITQQLNQRVNNLLENLESAPERESKKKSQWRCQIESALCHVEIKTPPMGNNHADWSDFFFSLHSILFEINNWLSDINKDKNREERVGLLPTLHIHVGAPLVISIAAKRALAFISLALENWFERMSSFNSFDTNTKQHPDEAFAGSLTTRHGSAMYFDPYTNTIAFNFFSPITLHAPSQETSALLRSKINVAMGILHAAMTSHERFDLATLSAILPAIDAPAEQIRTRILKHLIDDLFGTDTRLKRAFLGLIRPDANDVTAPPCEPSSAIEQQHRISGILGIQQQITRHISADLLRIIFPDGRRSLHDEGTAPPLSAELLGALDSPQVALLIRYYAYRSIAAPAWLQELLKLDTDIYTTALLRSGSPRDIGTEVIGLLADAAVWAPPTLYSWLEKLSEAYAAQFAKDVYYSLKSIFYTTIASHGDDARGMQGLQYLLDMSSTKPPHARDWHQMVHAAIHGLGIAACNPSTVGHTALERLKAIIEDIRSGSPILAHGAQESSDTENITPLMVVSVVMAALTTTITRGFKLQSDRAIEILAKHAKADDALSLAAIEGLRDALTGRGSYPPVILRILQEFEEIALLFRSDRVSEEAIKQIKLVALYHLRPDASRINWLFVTEACIESLVRILAKASLAIKTDLNAGQDPSPDQHIKLRAATCAAIALTCIVRPEYLSFVQPHFEQPVIYLEDLAWGSLETIVVGDRHGVFPLEVKAAIVKAIISGFMTNSKRAIKCEVFLIRLLHQENLSEFTDSTLAAIQKSVSTLLYGILKRSKQQDDRCFRSLVMSELEEYLDRDPSFKKSLDLALCIHELISVECPLLRVRSLSILSATGSYALIHASPLFPQLDQACKGYNELEDITTLVLGNYCDYYNLVKNVLAALLPTYSSPPSDKNWLLVQLARRCGLTD
jgi:hypothetical protein